MIKDPFVFKVLDLSTVHMTEEDAEKLNPCSGIQSLSYELGEYGWLIYIGEMKENWGDEMSEAFMNALKEAKELGCDYVRFDRDGRTYEELPVFDW
jgi:hypothetical protein